MNAGSLPTQDRQTLIQSLQTQVKQYRRKVIVYRLLTKLPWLLIVSALTYGLSSSIVYCSLSMVLVSTFIIWRIIASQELAAIHLDNYLLHLNRRYPELEESAQLINCEVQNLVALQQLQQQKVTELLSTLLANQQLPDSSDYKLQRPLLINLITLALLSAGFFLAESFLLQQWNNSQTPVSSNTTATPTESADAIRSVKVTAQPPDYSQLPLQQTQDLNISLLAGSEVKWQLDFQQSVSPSAHQYMLELSSGERIPLIPDNAGHFTATAIITQSAIYTVSTANGKLDEVYTLTVTADRAPQIRFLTPSTSTSEIAKDGIAELASEVIVTDDFAISKVSIQASIAKGSGEGVKFRDQNFEFDTVELIDGKAHYKKHWQLTELGMEPGDEMYFSVLAWDNREPEPQLTRSPSKIVRWLEEEQSELASDGILLDVMPEYFKSQRQIIIETEQLLLDEEQLELSEFKRTSTDLGFAQSDLKQKYGQFLGDEFEGETLHNMESGPNHQMHEDEDQHAQDDTDAEHNDHAPAAQHEHEPEPHLTQDKSGASELIAQYGHNHGEAELGFTGFKGQPSPTALMKQAIGNMWQAELHLMMSEPAKALPYEQEALKFLNQAKKAERIYVKRLGFEPPPVSESRRYQGELKDIKNATQQQQSALPSAQTLLLSSSINALEQWLTTPKQDNTLSLKTAQLKELQDLLMSDLASSPVNIQHIATLEKLSLDANQLKQECSHCIKQLQQKLWSLLPAVVAAPMTQQKSYLLSNPALTGYLQFLQQEQKP